MLTIVRKLPSLVEALDPTSVARMSSEVRVTELSIGPERFRHHRLDNLQIISDSCAFQQLDAVFPLHPESLLLSLIIPWAPAGGAFLDAGCGSGILPVIAARKGWDATAIDTNPRALAFAGASAALNHCSLALQKRDIRSFSPRRRFDFVTLNLPFEPNGGIACNFVHSDGGRLGHELNCLAARRLPRLLAKGGVAVMMAFSLQKNGRSVLEEWLRTSSLPLSPTLIRLSPQIPIRVLLLRYGNRVGAKVQRALKAEGYSSFFIEIVIFENCRVPRPLEVLRAPLADESWIYPIGEKALTTPRGGQ